MDRPFGIPGFSDPVSSLSHLVAAAVFALLAWPLVRRGFNVAARAREGAGRTVALAIFAASAVMLLAVSGAFHLLSPGGAARAVVQRLDHACIFILIAGTFTPIHVIMFRGVWRWGVLALVWGAAAAGCVLKSVFFASVPESLGLGLYLGMGWIGLASFIGLRPLMPMRRLLPLILGGVAYTVGAAIDAAHLAGPFPRVVGSHEVFHFAVLAGLALHWRFVWTVAGSDAANPAGEGRRRATIEANALPDAPAWSRRDVFRNPAHRSSSGR